MKFQDVINGAQKGYLDIPTIGKIEVLRYGKVVTITDRAGLDISNRNDEIIAYTPDKSQIEAIRDFIDGEKVYLLTNESRFTSEKALLKFLRQRNYDASLTHRVLNNEEKISYVDSKIEVTIYRRLNGKYDFIEYKLV